MLGWSLLVPGSIFARDYRVIKPLNEGGMGAVYVVDQISTGKRRALKIMHPQLIADARSRARFADEATIGARIDSEHVVEVVAAGVDETSGMPWLAMELLDGSDLEAVIRRGKLPHAAVAEILNQLAHALSDAHAKGIVHSDLKPENIFLAKTRRRGEEFMVKILDFGIARTTEVSRTAATVTTAIGSPLWMAPEQATPGAKIRASTDVWALGLIAFYGLVGKPYWRVASLEVFSLSALFAEVMALPMDDASVRARELGQGPLPDGFDAWFARCVNRDPMQRFPNAGSAIAALTPLLVRPRVESTLQAPSTPDAVPSPGVVRVPPPPEEPERQRPQPPAAVELGLARTQPSMPTSSPPVDPPRSNLEAIQAREAAIRAERLSLASKRATDLCRDLAYAAPLGGVFAALVATMLLNGSELLPSFMIPVVLVVLVVGAAGSTLLLSRALRRHSLAAVRLAERLCYALAVAGALSWVGVAMLADDVPGKGLLLLLLLFVGLPLTAAGRARQAHEALEFVEKLTRESARVST